MNYEKVDTLLYIKEGLESGELEPIQARKVRKARAVRGKEGQKVTTWSTDKDGNELIVMEAVVTVDKKTGKEGWILTKVDDNGNEVIDDNGHKNEWVISDSKFWKKYEKISGKKDIYESKAGVQLLIPTNDNITIENGERIADGGYINITDPDNIYGIPERDFEDLYEVIDTTSKRKK